MFYQIMLCNPLSSNMVVLRPHSENQTRFFDLVFLGARLTAWRPCELQCWLTSSFGDSIRKCLLPTNIHTQRYTSTYTDTHTHAVYVYIYTHTVDVCVCAWVSEWVCVCMSVCVCKALRPVFSDGCQLSVALSASSGCVPKTVRALWDEVVGGQVSVSEAPSCFRASPIAAPFVALKASVQP